jgi:tRNA threonylcarbamoyladenosine biosynthesis protein TsaE
MTPGLPTVIDLHLPDPDATSRVAVLLAECLPTRLCVWLCGDLGAGKTHFARALLRALGWQGPVRSPTYTLLEVYPLEGIPSTSSIGQTPDKLEANSRLLLYHFDLYRMASPDEWSEAGFDDLVDPAVRLIEWPERGGARVPQPDLRFELQAVGAGRSLRVAVCTPSGEEA